MGASVAELWERGELRAATDASAAALALRMQPFRDDGGGDIELASALHDHGTRCWHTARFEESEQCLERALDVRRSLLGDMHLDTLATLERLAGLASYQQQNELADERYRLLLDSLKGIEGDKGVRLAVARRNYASHLRGVGERAGARELMDRATKILRRSGSALERHALHKADAFLHHLEGHDLQSLDLVEQALRAPLPAHHPFLAAALLIAARVLERLSSPREALDALATAIPDLEAAYGDHPLVAIGLHLRGRILFETDDGDGARAALERAVPMYARWYPGDRHMAHDLEQLRASSARASDPA